MLRALDDTETSSSIILETYTSDAFIKTDDNNKAICSKMGAKFTTNKLAYARDISPSEIILKNKIFLGISCI
jgi:hypothetical protein